MSAVLVGLPVQQHTRRFHLEKGRRWNVIEHLLLQAVVDRPRSAGELANDGGLPRRVVLEALIRLMRAGWVELKAGTAEVRFHATERGRSIANDEDLPVVTEPMARKMSFAVDLVTCSIFRRRDLSLVWPNEWRTRTEGRRSIEIAAPQVPLRDLGHISSLLGALLEEDERLVRAELSDRAPADRIAVFTVRNGEVEGLPAQSPPALREAILDAARRSPASDPAHLTAVQVTPAPVRSLRPERRVQFRQEDFVLGGSAHRSHIETALRRSRKHVVIHSTFLRRDAFEALIPALRVAVERGGRVDMLWGQSTVENGVVRSLAEAAAINQMLSEAGLAGPVVLHPPSTRSHAKLLVADDGAGGWFATVGSCNWLYSGFDSFEASVRLRDPRLVADVLGELAELLRPSDAQLPDLSVRLAETGRELASKTAPSGASKVRLLIGEEHDDCTLEACASAERMISVFSHRLGVTAKPSIIVPGAAAVKDRGVSVELLYSLASGSVTSAVATEAMWEYLEQGVALRAVQRPRLHAKMLLWDSDDAVISSLNWLSADATNRNPRDEIGVRISSPRVADHLRETYKTAQMMA